MFIKQVSVFMENRKGMLEKVTATLRDNDINIASLSLADTSEYGLARMIVSDPQKAKEVLREHGFSAMLTEVIAVKLPQEVGVLNHLLKLLSEGGLNVEYMYVLCTEENTGAMVLKTSDSAKAIEAVEAGNMEVLTEEKAYAARIL